MNEKQRDENLRKALQNKNWNTIKTHDSWAVFQMMAEFVEGFDRLASIGPCVSIFGSARTKKEDKHYELTEEIANRFVKNGFGVISGGGPGIMEAANKGAYFAGGNSVGLNIDLPFEQSENKYIDPDKLINFKYFHIRKYMFMKYSQAFIVMPGGFGTLDELFQALTLIQTLKMAPFPIVLVVKDFWGGLVDWLKETMLKEQKISIEDLDLFVCVDTAEEAVKHIVDFYAKYEDSLKPNL